MAKYLKALLIMLALTVAISGVSMAATSPKACIDFVTPFGVPSVVSQEAACSCYYGEGGYGFGTLAIPNWRTTLGVDYSCNFTPPNGLGVKTMTFTLSSNGVVGNCAAQHVDSPKTSYPNFYYGVNYSEFYMQIGLRNASGVIYGWDCKDDRDRQIWTKIAGGDGSSYVTFQITKGGSPEAETKMWDGNNPFYAGTPVRMSTTCSTCTDPSKPLTCEDSPNKIYIDDCTLCTNCSSVTLTRSGTSVCQEDKNFDPPTGCPSTEDGYTVPPWTIFRSQNQFATTVVPGPGPIGIGQIIGKMLFNGIVDIYYSPDKAKGSTGFTNNPQSWDVVDNWTDMGCYYFCSNTSQICGDYCCYGPYFRGIDTNRLIFDSDGTFKFDLAATQKWSGTGVQNEVKAWVGDKLDGTLIYLGLEGATPFNRFFNLSSSNLVALGIDLTSVDTASVAKPICIFAQTQDRTDKPILTRSFVLDHAQFEMGSTKALFWKTTPYKDGKFPILPPEGKRWMGAWRINGMQFTVGFGYTDSRYLSRCTIANKGDETVNVWFDMTAVSSCSVAGQDFYTCLQNKIDPNSSISLGQIKPKGVKYVDIGSSLKVYKSEGVVDPDVSPNPIPFTGLASPDRYSYMFTVGNDAANQIVNVGSAVTNWFFEGAVAGGPTDPKTGNYELYSGTPLGPAYNAPIEVTCIMKDPVGSGTIRTIPVSTGSWNANPWQY